jgi:pimeloyl-ACP methyl ester carboxylesterase
VSAPRQIPHIREEVQTMQIHRGVPRFPGSPLPRFHLTALHVFFLLLLVLLPACLWKPLLHQPPIRDEVVYAETEDGWRLAMHRYRPGVGVPAHSTPVIVVHGISANARTWSLTPERSLPRYLAARGWDVWSVDLRGVGESDSPRIWNRHSFDYNFDTYVNQDVPAILREVGRQTGARQFHWVGHSMGGMIAYAYAATHGDRRFRSLTTVGTPVVFEGMSGYMAWAQTAAPRMNRFLFTIPERWFVPAIAPFGSVLHLRYEYLIWNFDNFEQRAAQEMIYNGSADIAGGVLRQVGGWFAGKPFGSADGEVDYLAGLERLRTPLLVMAGTADQVALVQNVRPAYERAGSRQKRFRVFGRMYGDRSDYGHMDLPIGDTAPLEVYPEIADWLRAHP